MRLAFFSGNTAPFDANSLDSKPLGGTESGVIYLSKELASRGHEVHIFRDGNEEAESNPHYHPKAAIEQLGDFDLLVSVRDWIPLLMKVSAKRRFFWTGDSYDQFPNFGIGDRRVAMQIDRFLAVSEWQAHELSERSGFPKEKMRIIRNGVDLSRFGGEETRHRKRLIYSSTPYRGLEHCLRYIPPLRSQHPELEFHIFSGYQVYGQSDESLLTLRAAFSQIPGAVWHGNISQAPLAREFMKSSILFYPCHFEETSCITAMEAMAAGCVPLTTQLAALPETIENAGILVTGRPGEKAYDEEFLKTAHQLLVNDELWREKQQIGKNRVQKELTWNHVADRFENILSEVF